MILYLCDAYFPLMLHSFVEFGDTNLMICCGGQASPGSVQGLNKCIKVSVSISELEMQRTTRLYQWVIPSQGWFAWNVMEQSLNIYRGYCEILASCIKYVSRYIFISGHFVAHWNLRWCLYMNISQIVEGSIFTGLSYHQNKLELVMWDRFKDRVYSSLKWSNFYLYLKK